MDDIAPNVTGSQSFNALVEELLVLQRALDLAREDPEVFARTNNLDIPPDVAVQQIERALEITAARVAGVGIASLLVSAPDESDAVK